MEWETTSSVLAGLKGSDGDRAWERLVNHFREPIVRFARRHGLAEADAEDAAQEAFKEFTVALGKGAYDPSEGRLHSWLFGFVDNAVRNTRQKVAKRQNGHEHPKGSSDALGEVPAEDTSKAWWNDAWQYALYKRCLRQVRLEFEASTYEAFILYGWEGRPIEDVAQALKMTPNAIRIAKSRVLKRIRELFNLYLDA